MVVYLRNRKLLEVLLTATILAPTALKKKKEESHGKQVDWRVPYKTLRDTHVVRGEQEKRWTEIHN